MIEISERWLAEFKEQFLERLVFDLLYEEVRRLFGEAAARQLIFKTMKEAAKFASREMKYKNSCELLTLPFKAFNIKASCKASEGHITLTVSECPLLKYDSSKIGKPCVVMTAFLAGLIETLINKKVLVETPRVLFGNLKAEVRVALLESLATGHNRCLFVIKGLSKGEASESSRN